MKKLLSGAAFLLLMIGATASLQAAECPAAAPVSSATAAPPQDVFEPEQGQTPPGLNGLETDVLGSALEMLPPPPNCENIACQLTPTGCSCQGFYCRGVFICGIPWF